VPVTSGPDIDLSGGDSRNRLGLHETGEPDAFGPAMSEKFIISSASVWLSLRHRSNDEK
jgi:hypothetical protein